MASLISSYDPDLAAYCDPPVQQNFSGSYLLSASPVRLSMYFSVDCFAMRLAQFLIEIIRMNLFPLTREGCFQESFYRRCLSDLEDSPLSQEVDDTELLAIYLKQTVIMMKTAGILHGNGGIARVSDPLPPAQTLYARLFHSFWNDIEWDNIFTSSTELARELKKNRYILMDLTLKHAGSVTIEELASDFFEMTGFSGPGDLFAISFLDFYYFTWLRHFGIITYSSSGDFSPVSIEVTEQGRMLMKAAI